MAATAVIVGVARETAAGERRVALSPETWRKVVAAGATVGIQPGVVPYAPTRPASRLPNAG